MRLGDLSVQTEVEHHSVKWSLKIRLSSVGNRTFGTYRSIFSVT